MTQKKVIFIVGPTGVGKSEIAFKLAQKLDGEIISADSMQVYRGMDIGTAKTSARLRKKIPHHLIDIVSPSTAFSAYRFCQLARKVIKKICAKGKIPIVAGGSGLYVRALLQGITPQPGPDPVFRREMVKIAVTEGLTVLYQRLQKENPQAAAKIKPNDKKRIIRALEIAHVIATESQCFRHAGGNLRFPSAEAISVTPLAFPSPLGRGVGEGEVSLKYLGFSPIVIGVTKDRAELYADIEKRVDQMFRRGLVGEVKKIMQKRMSATAREAIGYREIRMLFLQSRKSKTASSARSRALSPEKLASAKALIKRNTRRYAKRQITWFKREQGIQWFERSANETSNALCIRILESIKSF